MATATPMGIMPAVFTPLHDDQTINYAIIPAYAKYLADAGLKDFLIGGTTSENQTLSVAERKKLIDAWMEATKTNRTHIQVQVGGAPFADVLDLARYCQAVGVNSILTLPELYFKPSNVEELVFYVSQVANAAPDLPIFYYHNPSRTRVEVNMPAFVSAATATIPNFKGIKFASKDLYEAAQVLRILKDGQQILAAEECLLAPAALLGIKHSTCTSYSFFSKIAQDILNAVEQSDVQTARILQEKLSQAVDALTCEGPCVPVMKAAMEIVTGIKVGPPCLPQKPISAEAKLRIQSKLKALGFCN